MELLSGTLLLPLMCEKNNGVRIVSAISDWILSLWPTPASVFSHSRDPAEICSTSFCRLSSANPAGIGRDDWVWNGLTAMRAPEHDLNLKQPLLLVNSGIQDIQLFTARVAVI